MEWITRLQNAIDYIECNLDKKLDYDDIAKRAYSSNYHFQRVFGLTCGLTLGEYIRRRKLTVAGNAILLSCAKISDVAFKYGYETPESFSRAFKKFHGVTPSQAKNGQVLRTFPRIVLDNDFSGVSAMTYKIEEKPEIILVGYKKRFSGVPYGEERAAQEEAFLTKTRAKQWLLLGASCDYATDYLIITNVGDDGYDFYVAYELDGWTRSVLFNPAVTGVDFMDKMGFETIVIPKQIYVIFETEKKKRPVKDYADIRKRIVTEWIPSTDFAFKNAPEVVAMHWRPNGEWAKERYIEVRLPIEKL